MSPSAERSSAKLSMPGETFSFLRIARRDEERPSQDPYLPKIELPCVGTSPDVVEESLRQRVRELNCLYGICEVIRNNGNHIHAILQGIVDILPCGWQYPEVVCARIVFHGNVFTTNGFRSTKWQLSHFISIYDRHVGDVTVGYLEEPPAGDEGPFLSEQRILLAAVAEQVSCTVRRISANVELKEMGWRLTVQQQTLQETNAALRALATQVEEEKREVCRNTQENLERVLTPILSSLLTQSSKSKKGELEFLKRQIEEATSPFTRKLTKECYSLTPTEISICNYIRGGLKTKDIAEMRGVSVATINRHREHIRRKLGISNSDVNLSTFLQSAMWEQD